jgi:acyl-CoA hydrolase
MSYEELYKQKVISAEDAVQKVNSDDEIYVSVAASEPAGLLSKLHIIKERVRNVSVVMTLPLGAYDFYMKPDMKDHFLLNAWYYGAGCRQVHDTGTVSYCPTHVHDAVTKRAPLKKNKIYFGTAAPMDKHGYLNLSVGMMIEKDALDYADLVVIEVNENLPRTHGDTQIHIRHKCSSPFQVDLQYLVRTIFGFFLIRINVQACSQTPFFKILNSL